MCDVHSPEPIDRATVQRDIVRLVALSTQNAFAALGELEWQPEKQISERWEMPLVTVKAPAKWPRQLEKLDDDRVTLPSRSEAGL
jgi:hypothetical protein